MAIENISFIMIAQNEEFAINKCLSSLKKMNLSDCELICIDSNSTDNTLSVIKSFRNDFREFKIFSIKGYSNPSIARNVGIRNAVKKYIFFIDGDIEIFEDFITKNYPKLEENITDAVVGDLKENYYSPDYSSIIEIKPARDKFKREFFTHVSGGTFLTKKDVINDIGYFNEKLEQNEDNEFTLRLTKKYKMMAVPQIMGIHHTIPYENPKRIKNSFQRFHPIFMGIVFRKNIFNFKGLYSFSKSIYGTLAGGLLLFAFLLILLLIPKPVNFLIILGLIFMDLIYGVLKDKNINSIFYRFPLHFIYPLFFIVGLFFNINLRKEYRIIEVKWEKKKIFV